MNDVQPLDKTEQFLLVIRYSMIVLIYALLAISADKAIMIRQRLFDSLEKEAHILDDWKFVEHRRHDLVQHLWMSATVLTLSPEYGSPFLAHHV